MESRRSGHVRPSLPDPTPPGSKVWTGMARTSARDMCKSLGSNPWATGPRRLAGCYLFSRRPMLRARHPNSRENFDAGHSRSMRLQRLPARRSLHLQVVAKSCCEVRARDSRVSSSIFFMKGHCLFSVAVLKQTVHTLEVYQYFAGSSGLVMLTSCQHQPQETRVATRCQFLTTSSMLSCYDLEVARSWARPQSLVEMGLLTLCGAAESQTPLPCLNAFTERSTLPGCKRNLRSAWTLLWRSQSTRKPKSREPIGQHQNWH